MATTTATTTVEQIQVQDLLEPAVPLLDQRFIAIKQSLVKDQHRQKVIESYSRLCQVLKDEADFIHANGPQMIPEIQFDDVISNGKHIACSELAALLWTGRFGHD